MIGRLSTLLSCLFTAAAATLPAIPPEMALAPLPLRPPDPPNNPTTPEKVALGRLLFFDPILSANREVACATCHHPAFGWADGRAIPIGVGGEGLGPARIPLGRPDPRVLDRNAPTLLNVGFNGLVSSIPLDPSQAPMFWESRTESLEAQVLFPLRAREEMRGDSCREGAAVDLVVERVGAIQEYRERFASAFGLQTGNQNTAVNTTRLAQVIAAFERSLVAANSPYDQFLRGDSSALNAAQQRGLREFQDAGCVRCHGGPMLSDFKQHVLGVPDPLPGGRRGFRTPSLRQLRDSGPYMHHGRLRTLDEVLQFYEELMDAVGETLDGGDVAVNPPLDPLLRQLNVRAANATDLRSFLEALQDDHYDRSVPLNVPSGLKVGGR